MQEIQARFALALQFRNAICTDKVYRNLFIVQFNWHFYQMEHKGPFLGTRRPTCPAIHFEWLDESRTLGDSAKGETL
jgi:hypothetical protein